MVCLQNWAYFLWIYDERRRQGWDSAIWPNPGEKAQALLEKLLKCVGLAKENAPEEEIWLIAKPSKQFMEWQGSRPWCQGLEGQLCFGTFQKLEVVGLEPLISSRGSRKVQLPPWYKLHLLCVE